MKIIQTILTVISVVMICSFATAQGNCPGNKIKVYKGASGCGCHCQKECVTPAELPTYLADGWNTTGCWNCCWMKNWVDTKPYKTTVEQVQLDPGSGSITVSFTLASESNVKIHVSDMAGQHVATVADEHIVSHDNELIWDERSLRPGLYFLNFEADGYRETKLMSVAN